MKKQLKSILVIFGAIIFSTIVIEAGDVLQNTKGGIAGIIVGTEDADSVCDENAVLINGPSGTLCVDKYEASTGPECEIVTPENQVDTQKNINNYSCTTSSKAGVLPWRFVSLNQAQQLCARSGKRLPTSAEWYMLASAQTQQDYCVTNASGPAKTGLNKCQTQSGIHDMVGNVWEWVNQQVQDGVYNGRKLPESGFVQLADVDGVVIETGLQMQDLYGNDYAITSSEGIRGMVRGGFFGSGDDAGIYAQNISVPLDIRTNGIGFRCVKDIR